MDDSKYKSLFPTKIPLGKAPATLFLSGVPGLDQIPDDGYILIQIQKEPTPEAEPTGAPEEAGEPPAPEGEGNGVELHVLSVCLPEAEAEGDVGDKYGWMDQAAKKLGVNTKGGAEGSPEEEAAETPEEEAGEKE